MILSGSKFRIVAGAVLIIAGGGMITFAVLRTRDKQPEANVSVVSASDQQTKRIDDGDSPQTLGAEAEASTEKPDDGAVTGQNSGQNSTDGKLFPEDVQRYENLWKLFAKYESLLVENKCREAMAMEGELATSGVGSINPQLLISGYTNYNSQILASFGTIWTHASTAQSRYTEACRYFMMGGTADKSKGEAKLNEAKAALEQAKNIFAGLPK